MRWHLAFLSSAFLALALPSAASAAQIISSGTYGPDAGWVHIGNNYPRAESDLPKGKYRFNLEVSTPLTEISGRVWVDYYNYHSQLYKDGRHVVWGDDYYERNITYFYEVTPYL